MKHIICIMLVLGFAAAGAKAQVEGLSSGDVVLEVNDAGDGHYLVGFKAYGKEWNTNTECNPTLVLDMKSRVDYVSYDKYTKNGDELLLEATYSPDNRATFTVTDTYISKGDGAYTLSRSIKVSRKAGSQLNDGFYSSFGISPEAQILTDYEYFIPSVWYRSNFERQANLSTSVPQATDMNFLYRDDRTPLPVVMMRDKTSGQTLTIIETDSPCQTVLKDATGLAMSADFQFGGTGVINREGSNAYVPVVTFPGSDNRTGGLGDRRHPVTDIVKHDYKVYFSITQTADYASATETAWKTAFNLYNPEVRTTDQRHAFDALIETLDEYYLSPTGDSKQDYETHEPGFPWSVYLTDFHLNATTYEIGFVGGQTEAGYAMLHEGLVSNKPHLVSRGAAIIDFWAERGHSELGMPYTRYYNLDGRWDKCETSLRQACTGMTAVLEAWCFYRKYGVDRKSWYDASVLFGDYLVKKQAHDGSYCFSYNPFEITGTSHPAVKTNKFLTICAVRYLVELYIATGEEKYRTAAEKAAEWSMKNIHDKYFYLACVIDNPQQLDSESGQQAIQAFLAMYDLTHEQRWLDAARQAAIYLESYVYMHEIPVETDQNEETDWPRDRSVVGQHIITIAQPAADLGFAWSSFFLYRLYLYTGDEHFLHTARISAHNTKQSMNLYQALYPDRPEGLQQEACTLRTAWQCSRRTHSIMEALTWNFAAHLDPMIRMQDAFGSVDIEAVEAMPLEKRQQLNEAYSVRQAADWGQDTPTPLETRVEGCGNGLTGEYWVGSSDFGNPIPDVYRNTDFHKSPEQDEPGVYAFTRIDPVVDFNWGTGNPFDDTTDEKSFSIAWTGYLQVPETGSYIIDLTQCDDAFSLQLTDVDEPEFSVVNYDREYIGGKNFGFHWNMAKWRYPAFLQQGHTYKLVLKYFDNAYGAQIHLRWQPNGESETVVIPQSQLYADFESSVGAIPYRPHSSTTYDLLGRRVNKTHKGNIVIEEGRKLLR